MRQESDYLIIGAGMSGAAASAALRKLKPNARITMLGNEKHPPYKRPPLSKDLWSGKKEDEIWLRKSIEGVDLQLGRTALRIDPAAHTVHDDQNTEWRYTKLLLATGGRPRQLPYGDDFIYFRTVDDYRTLAAAAKEGTRVTVIGGGFIGSEIAASLVSKGCAVTLVFPGNGICARAFPQGLTDYVTEYYRTKGVDVRSGVGVQGRNSDGSLQLSDGTSLAGDVVVAGLGIIPNSELAEAAGLALDRGGIVVNEHMQTSDPDIYAAGDVASFPAAALERNLRAEHESAARGTGKHAGLNMGGEDAPYLRLPFFYSDLFDLGYEAVGVLDAKYEVVEHWSKPYRKGVLYYLDGGRIRGILLWNVWNQVDAARELIAQEGPFDAQNVIGLLPKR